MKPEFSANIMPQSASCNFGAFAAWNKITGQAVY